MLHFIAVDVKSSTNSRRLAGRGLKVAAILLSIVWGGGYCYKHLPAQSVDGNYRNQSLSTEDCDPF